jgi:hypothetical protein
MDAAAPDSPAVPGVFPLIRAPGAGSGFDRLGGALALRVPDAVAPASCARWVAGVQAARRDWTTDFGGEQFSLGRAWDTHLEQGRARDYFRGAAESDGQVERAAPGLQGALRGLLAELLGAEVRQRRGWCGAGVHVFPAGEQVGRAGGVLHFDLEGLTEEQREERAAAVSLVAMLQAPEEGGGLRLWDLLYDGLPDTELDDGRLARTGSAIARYATGEALLFDSYRLHQIQPFGGRRARLSATLHAVRVDAGMWEAWF